jgi:flagellar biogenesis protein FliO
MPRELCFLALLVLALPVAEGVGQEFDTSSFGSEIATRIASASVPSSQADPEPGEKPSASSLVRPAVHETPDNNHGTVRRVGYSVPVDAAATDGEAPVEPSASEAPPDSTATVQLDASSRGDRGFPALVPPGDSRQGGGTTATSPQGLGSVATVISSLAIVLGLFFVTAWFLRRAAPGGLATLPGDVFEVLGRAQLNSRQQVQLLRCGAKLLLVCVTPDGAETLTEIDDPDEVTRLAGLCKASHAGSATAAFRQVLHQIAGQPTEPGFVGRADSQVTRAEMPRELENLHG